MQTLFTSLLLVFAATSATAQVPVVEQAFIVTKITITDQEGNATAPPSSIYAAEGYRRGDACTFTTETWHQAGNNHVSAKYGSWRFVTIRNKEAQQTIGYTALANPDEMANMVRLGNLPPGATVVARTPSGGTLQPANLPPGATVVTTTRVIDAGVGTMNLPQNGTTRVVSSGSMSSGLFITDAELAAEKKELESNPNRALPVLDTTGVQVMVILQDVQQEIAGYPCKRAVISLLRNDSLLAQIKAWYNTEVRLPDLPATGNPFDGSFNILNNQMEHFYALAKLPGLAMRYEMPDLYGNTISVEVTKLKINKKPHRNQFKAPGSVNLRPFAEVKNKRVQLTGM